MPVCIKLLLLNPSIPIHDAEYPSEPDDTIPSNLKIDFQVRAQNDVGFDPPEGPTAGTTQLPLTLSYAPCVELLTAYPDQFVEAQPNFLDA